MSAVGRVPLLVTSSPTPSSIAARCASSRLPTTTTSPGPISLGSRSMSIAMHQIWPETSPPVPEISSPSSTRTIASTLVGASSSDGSRDSRM